MTFPHIVKFNEWCPKCAHWEKSESEDPCWECLNECKNFGTDAPVRFEERKNKQPITGEKKK